jgi:hypothetical protein
VRSALALGLLVLGAVPAASATEATFGLPDPEGDGGAGDVVTVIGALDERGFVQVLFASGASLQDVSIRGVLVSGAPGSPEPSEWYQFTVAAGAATAQVFAAHGTPREVAANASWNGSIATLRFDRSEASGSGCTFAVVEAGTFGDGGFEVLDVAPQGFASMDAAWPVSACPSAGAPLAQDAVVDEKGSPGLALPALALAVAAAASWRRR